MGLLFWVSHYVPSYVFTWPIHLSFYCVLTSLVYQVNPLPIKTYLVMATILMLSWETFEWIFRQPHTATVLFDSTIDLICNYTGIAIYFMVKQMEQKHELTS